MRLIGFEKKQKRLEINTAKKLFFKADFVQPSRLGL